MLKFYIKLMLFGVMFLISSCSVFKSGPVNSTVSVDDLLKEDIVASNPEALSNLDKEELLEDEEDLSLEEDEGAVAVKKTSSEGGELSLEEDSGSGELSLEEDSGSGELSLEEDSESGELSLEEDSGSGELSLEEDSGSGELSLEENNGSDDLSSNSSEEIAVNKSEDDNTDLNFPEEISSEGPTSEFSVTSLESIKYSQKDQEEVISINAKDKIEYSTRFNKKNNQFIIELKNVVLSEKLKRPYFMKDFSGGSVIAINSYQESDSDTANIVLQLRNGVNSAPQITNIGSHLELKYSLGEAPLRAGQASEHLARNGKSASKNFADNKKVTSNTGSLANFFLGGGSYYGHPISLQFEEVGVRQVINYIASEVGANILVDDKVNGKISLKLRNIPWDQALALVLKSKGLGYIQEKGGVLRISSLDNLKKEEEALVAIIKSQKNLTPLSVKILPISFAKSVDLAAKLKVFLTPKRGAVSADARSNTLILTDTPEVLEKISLLVKSLDQAPSQVSIEAKFIEASTSFTKNLGVNWNFTGGRIDINGLQGSNGPVSVGLDAGRISAVSNETLSGLSGVIGLTLGSFSFLGDLSSVLAIAETDQKVKVISSPTVVVLDKQKASIINQGENVYVEGSVGEGGVVTNSIQRTPIKLQLDVSPQIAADGNILLDVNIIREFAGAAISTNNSAREINSRTVKSKVLIKNGDTLVIGGIFQKDTTKGYRGVPFLSKLPLFGWLFKYQSDEEKKNELVVFLTPKIL